MTVIGFYTFIGNTATPPTALLVGQEYPLVLRVAESIIIVLSKALQGQMSRGNHMVKSSSYSATATLLATTVHIVSKPHIYS